MSASSSSKRAQTSKARSTSTSKTSKSDVTNASKAPSMGPAIKPVPKPISPALKKAIEDVSADRLRSTIVELVSGGRVPELEQELASKLLYSEGSAVKKKKRWLMCVNCHEEFDAMYNDDDEDCVYHPGELVLDEDLDFFIEHDEDPDDDWHRKEYPEGFMWDCCDTNAGGDLYEHKHLGKNPHPDEESDEARVRRLGGGCVLGKHVVAPEKEEAGRDAKKRKMV